MKFFSRVIERVGCPRCTAFAGEPCKGTKDYPDAVCLIRWSLYDGEDHDPGDEDRR